MDTLPFKGVSDECEYLNVFFVQTSVYIVNKI